MPPLGFRGPRRAPPRRRHPRVRHGAASAVQQGTSRAVRHTVRQSLPATRQGTRRSVRGIVHAALPSSRRGNTRAVHHAAVVHARDHHTRDHQAIQRANDEARAQREIITALTRHPKKLKHFSFGLDAIGSGKTADARRHTETHVEKAIEKNRLVYDGRNVFRYHPPGHVAVQKNIKRLFKGTRYERQHALKKLQHMGVVSGGKPSPRFFEYVGQRPYTREQRTHIMEIMTGARKGHVTASDRAEIEKANARVAQWQQAHPYPVAQAAHKVQQGIGVLTGHGGGTKILNAGIDSTVAGHLQSVATHGLLSGGHHALGAVGTVLDRPVGSVESLVGKALVKAHVITNPKIVQRISHARSPQDVLLHGRDGKDQAVHGGDIAQGLHLPRQVGIVGDLALDPVMWIGAAALPETGGATSALIAERIAAKVGVDALKSPRLLTLADHAMKTRRFGDFENALREVAAHHKIRIPRNIMVADAKVLRELRARPTRDLIESIKTHEPVTVVPRRRLLARKLGRDHKPQQIHVLGKEGLDSVANVARSVAERGHRPGFQLRIIRPGGGKAHLPDFLGGRELPAARIPFPEDMATINLTKRARDFERQRRLDQIEADSRAAHAASIRPLEEELHSAQLAGDSAKVKELTRTIHSAEDTLARETRQAKQAVRDSRSIRGTAGASVAGRNSRRFQRQTSQFSQDLGRTVQARLDEAVLRATSTEGLSPKAARLARERVDLHLKAREAGPAAEGAIQRVLPLTPQEERIKENLIAVYGEQLKQAQEVGLVKQGVREFGGSRMYGDAANNPRNVKDVLKITEEMFGGATRHGGPTPQFAKRRTAPSVFDITDPGALADKIKQLSHEHLSDEEARAAAEQLFHTGRYRTHVELAARKLERGLPIHLDELPEEARHQLLTASRQDSPVFNINPSDEGLVKLGTHAERDYGFSHDAAYGSRPPHEATALKLASAQADKRRVEELLKLAGDDPKRTEALRHELKDLDEQIKALDVPVKDLPKEARDQLPAMGYGEHKSYTRRQKLKDGTVIKRQVGTTRLPKNLKASTVINDHGVAWIVPHAGEDVPAGLPRERFVGEPGPFDDPLDYGSRLPETRQPDVMPVLDPRITNFYRTRAQGRATAFLARWRAIDEAVGRSSHDEGLLRRGDIYYYDPKTGVEYMHPMHKQELADKRLELGEDRLWPTQTIQDAAAELHRDGEFDGVTRIGIEKGWERTLAYFRYGVTTPFPAYHVRNLISDLLKSLQADSGVVFHPIVNAKLALIAGGAKRLTVEIPGHGIRLSGQDFMLLADATGLKSGHHVAEVYKLIDNGAFSDSRLKAVGREAFPITQLLSPNSFFGQFMTRGGVAREDTTRFITFMQHMRSNGGDAADAAMYMIRHHFNYNDLSAAERRFARNTFLFYTWYRKNIPLQLVELVRRPGFFSGVLHSYDALARGETPLNQDWSQISPWLPDMSGELPQPGLVPDYFKTKLLAAQMDWNGHAVAVGFGAPWGDLQLLSGEGAIQDVPSFMNPALGFLYTVVSHKDLLTGRTLKQQENSGAANLLEKLGIHLPKDEHGHPILPFWLNQALNSLPIGGRASSAFTNVSPYRDQGRLSTLGRQFNWLTGLNIYVGPRPGGEREQQAYEAITKGRIAERDALNLSLSNRTDADKAKALAKFDKETRQWAKDHHVPMHFLKNTERSGFYVTQDERGGDSGGSTSKLGTIGAPQGHQGGKLGGSGTKSGPLKGPQSSSGASPGEQKTAAVPEHRKYGLPAQGGSGAPVASQGGSSDAVGSAFGETADGSPVASSGPVHHGRFDNEINAAAKRHHVDPALLKGLIRQESNFDPDIGSPAGAQGLTQLMPATARGLGVSNVHDPKQSIEGGAKYLRQQLDTFHGDVRKALAAYNAGPGAVQKYGGVPPYAETQHYVKAVLGFAHQYRTAPSPGDTQHGRLGGSIPGGPGRATIEGALRAPQQVESAPHTDTSAAIVDALLSHEKGGLLPAIMRRIDSGAYLVPGDTKTIPGRVPTVNLAHGSAGVALHANDRVKGFKQLFERAALIDGKHKPYLWGGGHGARPTLSGPWDCSGAVSAALGISPRVASAFKSYGRAGRGNHVTIWAANDHVLLEIDGHFWGTSHSNPGGGAGWIPRSVVTRAYLSRFTARHPVGM